MTNLGVQEAMLGTNPRWGHVGGALGVMEAPERSFPSLLGLIAAVYLTTVPLLSYARFQLAWLPQVAGGLVGLSWLTIGAIIKRQPVLWSWPIMIYLGWAGWVSFGILVAPTPVMVTFGTLAKVAAVTWILSQCVRSRADLLTCLLFVGFVGAVIFVQGQDEFVRAVAYKGKSETGARASTVFAANTLVARIGVFMLLADLTCFMAFRNKVLKLVSVALMPCPLYIIASQGSRTAMLCLPLAAVCLYVYHLRRAGVGRAGKKAVMLALGMAVVGASIYFVSKLPLLFRLIETFTSTDAIMRQPRFIFFVRGLEATAAHPIFGLGIGGYSAAGFGGISEFRYSHSTITETLSCTGIPGFLIYFAGQFVLYNELRKLRKADLPDQDATTVNLIMVMFWVLAFFNVVSVMDSDRLIWPLFGAICGYLAQLKARLRNPPASTGPFLTPEAGARFPLRSRDAILPR